MKNKKIVIANWKMKLTLKDTLALAEGYKNKFAGFAKGEIAVCPNFISLDNVARILAGSNVKTGAQNVFWEELDAITGEICPSLVKEAGCSYVIIGHSERRRYLMENYEMINKKLKMILASKGLTPVVCVGENWDERKTDRRDFVLFDQLQQAMSGVEVAVGQRVIVAYEPVWAIGSGTAIEPAEAEYAHKVIKLTLNDMFGEKTVANNFRIIYGGSISGKNVKDFTNLENIDGLLVGGASLDADEFFKVAKTILK